MNEKKFNELVFAPLKLVYEFYEDLEETYSMLEYFFPDHEFSEKTIPLTSNLIKEKKIKFYTAQKKGCRNNIIVPKVKIFDWSNPTGLKAAYAEINAFLKNEPPRETIAIQYPGSTLSDNALANALRFLDNE